MTYPKTTADNSTPENLAEKIRKYLAPVVATLILGGLLVGDLAFRVYPYWS